MTRLFLRVYFSPQAWIGPGKVQLLEAIRDTGSISAAARSLGMSYRRAWLLVAAVNGLFNSPAVRAAHGGRGGGTATLTPLGRQVIARYRAIEAAAHRAAARDVTALERQLRKRYILTDTTTGQKRVKG